MELCSATLSQRYRSERIPVPEVLRIAVKIGSAIETAHRQGVLHRDIKPSNILLTAYGHPVLSDFGIAATLGDAESLEAVGMSIPWSAPEVLMDETAGHDRERGVGVRRDRLLPAGRAIALRGTGRARTRRPTSSSRINRAKPQPIGRGDVPASLERALAKAMSRRPGDRQGSVLELVRQLQAVESEIGVLQTPIDLEADEWALGTVADLEDRTRIRPAVGATASAQRRRRRRGGAEDSYNGVGTLLRDSRNARSSGATAEEPRRGMRVLGWLLVAATAAMLVLGATATFVLVRVGSGDLPTVSGIQSQLSGDTVTFTWDDPGLRAGDSYRITVDDGSPPAQQREASFSVDSEPGARVCITVAVTREGKTGPPSAEKCMDVPA